MTKEDFIKKLVPDAKELGTTYDILPSLILGVACHESNFGDSTLAKEGNNLFGVKGNYEGESITLPTWEVQDGVRHDINAAFRKYPSFKESLQDFCNLIKNGVSWNKEIYHSVLGVKDWKEVIEKFAATPYMTDPNYFKKLYDITEQYHLYAYNEEDAAPKPAAPEPAPEPAAKAAAAPDTKAVPEDTQTPATTEEEEGGMIYVEYPKTLFKLGSKGNYVKMIQEKIDHGLIVDGIFGSITGAYVTVFQSENDLVPDGIVGEKTWNVLFNK